MKAVIMIQLHHLGKLGSLRTPCQVTAEACLTTLLLKVPPGILMGVGAVEAGEGWKLPGQREGPISSPLARIRLRAVPGSLGPGMGLA